MNSLLQSTNMPQKLVSYFQAAIASEFFQSVADAVLKKHYVTKYSYLFLSKKQLGLILTALYRTL